MWSAWIGFVLLAVNPFGGLLFAIPYAKAVLHISPWWAVLAGVPLAYVQVLVVDVFWDLLWRWGWWRRLVERRRTPRLEAMATSRYMFWLIAAFAPFFGPWLVMAVLRWSKVPHRRIVLPMVISLTWNAAAIALLTQFAPRLLPK